MEVNHPYLEKSRTNTPRQIRSDLELRELRRRKWHKLVFM